MKVKKYHPYTPSRRFMTVTDFSQITAPKPKKSLLRTLRRASGRDNRGIISIRHRGGGVKKKYRLVDFKQFNLGEFGEVKTIEYDPYRTAFIALIQYPSHYAYVLAPAELKVGAKIVADEKAEIAGGNRMVIKNIPSGVPIHNLELQPGGGGKLVRSAGNQAIIAGKDAKFVTVKLPSGEMRRFHPLCFASIGVLSNQENSNVTIGKAGRKRKMGIRPTVRGKAMYPAAHPHGGGEGNSPIGLKHPKTPWGKPALGVRTRRKRKPSNKFIVKRRK